MPQRAPRTRLTRREALRLFAGSVISIGALTGCRPSSRRGQSSSARESSSDAENATGPAKTAGATAVTDKRRDAVVARVAANERALLAAYDDAIARFPGLAAKLTPLRADHARHLDGITPGASTSASPSPSPTPAPAPPSGTNAAARSSKAPASQAATTHGSPSSASSPATAEALALLAALEHSAAAARLDDLSGTPGSLARLVASIGGSEAAHETLLKAMT